MGRVCQYLHNDRIFGLGIVECKLCLNLVCNNFIGIMCLNFWRDISSVFLLIVASYFGDY